MSTTPNTRQSLPPRLLTTDDVAAFLAMTTDQVKKMRATGNGPEYVQLGRRIRYVPRDLYAWIEGNRRGNAE